MTRNDDGCDGCDVARAIGRRGAVIGSRSGGGSIGELSAMGDGDLPKILLIENDGRFGKRNGGKFRCFVAFLVDIIIGRRNENS